MKRILPILFLMLISLTLVPSFVRADPPSIFISKGTCYATSEVSTFEASKGCDNNDATQWYAGVAHGYPQFIVLNLTNGPWHVTSVNLKAADVPAATGHIDIWTGTTFVAYKNFTGQLANTNVSIALDVTSILTTQIRIYGLTGVGGNNAMGYFEVWPKGFLQPIPVCQFGSIGTTLDTLIPILIGASLLAFVVGVFLFIGQGSGNEGHSTKIPIEFLILSAIGLVVMMVVASAVIASMKVCGG